MKAKRIIASILAGGMCLALASCGTEMFEDHITVAIWDSAQQENLQKIANEWGDKVGVDVTVDVIDWDLYWQQLEAGTQGEDMPDVFWMKADKANTYMENNLLLPLNDYINYDDEITLNNYYDGFAESFEYEDEVTKEKKCYALPQDHDTVALLYNKTIFDKYQISYPDATWTWENVYDAAKTITEQSNGDCYGFAISPRDTMDGWYNFVYTYGGAVVNEDHKGTQIASAQGRAGMGMVRRLLKYSVPYDMTMSTSTKDLAISGKAAMSIQSSSIIPEIYSLGNRDDFAWAIMPYADVNADGECQKEERWASYDGTAWVASKNASDPDACYSLMAYLASKEGQEKEAQIGTKMPAYHGLSTEFLNRFEGMDLTAFTAIEEQGTLFFRPFTKNTSDWEEKIQNENVLESAWKNPFDRKIMRQAGLDMEQIITQSIAAEQ